MTRDGDIEDKIRNRFEEIARATWSQDSKVCRDRILALPSIDRAIFTTMAADDQIQNGGLMQFFYNDFRAICAETIEDFDLVGASKHADILRRAMEIAMLNDFGSLDFDYYDAQNESPIAVLLANYITKLKA